MVNDMIEKEGWTRSYALSALRSKFETEERHQEVEYVNDLISKEAENQEQEKCRQQPLRQRQRIEKLQKR
jgi:hypothetical protein